MHPTSSEAVQHQEKRRAGREIGDTSGREKLVDKVGMMVFCATGNLHVYNLGKNDIRKDFATMEFRSV